MYYLSEKLQTYIAKIEKETGRQVLIQSMATNIGISGMSAYISDHPTHILILLESDIKENEQLERSIAHEVTHGLLRYAKEYCILMPTYSLTKLELDTLNILTTMIEDIVVNKIIQENGFSPFSTSFYETVRQETEAAHERQDYYQEFQDPLFKDRFMIFRYIMAWGFLEYYDLDESFQKILASFEYEFKLSFPRQYKSACQIKDIILQHDIFSAEGYCQVIKKSLKLWELDNIVNVKTYLQNPP